MIKKDNNEEIFPVVDENGTTVGKATRGECHSGSKLLHPVVHLHLFDSSGRIYLQQRPLWKDIQPGKWDTAVGGHIDYGETVEAALRRETQEELGLTDLSVEFLLKYVFESERERELVHVFRATYDGDVRPSDELDGGRFWSLDELQEVFGKGVLTIISAICARLLSVNVFILIDPHMIAFFIGLGSFNSKFISLASIAAFAEKRSYSSCCAVSSFFSS